MASSPGPISTPLTTLLHIRHPIILAGMARVSGGALAAAVSNAGGLGVIGGFQYTPGQLREIIAEMKAAFARPDLPFGVDLAQWPTSSGDPHRPQWNAEAACKSPCRRKRAFRRY